MSCKRLVSVILIDISITQHGKRLERQTEAKTRCKRRGKRHIPCDRKGLLVSNACPGWSSTRYCNKLGTLPILVLLSASTPPRLGRKLARAETRESRATNTYLAWSTTTTLAALNQWSMSLSVSVDLLYNALVASQSPQLDGDVGMWNDQKATRALGVSAMGRRQMITSRETRQDEEDEEVEGLWDDGGRKRGKRRTL